MAVYSCCAPLGILLVAIQIPAYLVNSTDFNFIVPTVP